MADRQEQIHLWSTLGLEYLKLVVSLPFILIVFLFLFYADLRSLLHDNRQLEIAGLVTIGARADTLVNNTQQELDDVRQRLASFQELLDSGSITAANLKKQGQELLENTNDKLNAIQTNIVREKSEIASAIVQAQIATPVQAAPTQGVASAGKQVSAAALYERQGFEALLRRDIDGAIAAFRQAIDVQADYHNVAEITRYLQKEKARTGLTSNSDSWFELMDDILTRYSWGMPGDIRERIRKEFR